MTTVQTWENLDSLLFEHPIALELNRLGVTKQQLESVRFWKKGEDCPFEEWPITWDGNIDPPAISLARSYCALKWIVSDDPPPSRDRNAAYHLVNETEIQPLVDAAERHSCSQSNRAKKKRNRMSDDGTTLEDVIHRLVVKPELADHSAKELWSHFYSALDAIGAAPKDNSSAQDPNSWTYEYETYSGKSKRITFGTFSNVVSKVRKSR